MTTIMDVIADARNTTTDIIIETIILILIGEGSDLNAIYSLMISFSNFFSHLTSSIYILTSPFRSSSY